MTRADTSLHLRLEEFLFNTIRVKAPASSVPIPTPDHAFSVVPPMLLQSAAPHLLYTTTHTAAMPVLAVTARFQGTGLASLCRFLPPSAGSWSSWRFLNSSMIVRRRSDLPTPAEPVKKKFSPRKTASKTCCCFADKAGSFRSMSGILRGMGAGHGPPGTVRMGLRSCARVSRWLPLCQPGGLRSSQEVSRPRLHGEIRGRSTRSV